MGPGCLQGLGKPPLGSSTLPQGPLLLLRPSGDPCGAGFPPTLGFGRYQSLCVGWRFPFSLIVKAFTTSALVSMLVTASAPPSTSLGSTAAARCRTLGHTLPSSYFSPSTSRLLQLCTRSCEPEGRGDLCGSVPSTPLGWWSLPVPTPCRVPD